MKINILLFGRLTDITGKDAFTLQDISDTDQLTKTLHQAYPQLAEANYILAVDKNVVATNTALTNDCTVALLPPFSGG